MKTNELLKLLKKNGCSLIRHGSNHDIWYSSVTGKQFAVPRHKKEIKPELPLLFCAMPEWILRKEILMSKYVYPAIFTSEPDGVILYIFPIWKVVIPAATHWLMLCLWLKMPSRLFSMDMKRTNAPFHSPPKCQTSKLLRIPF